MKFRVEGYADEIVCCGVYWNDKFGTFYYGLPPQYEGLIAYKDSEITVTDARLGDNFIFVKQSAENNFNMIVDKDLMKDNLLDDLVGCIEGAREKFELILSKR